MESSEEILPVNLAVVKFGYIEITCRNRRLRKPVIYKNITRLPNVQISRCNSNSGKSTDIIKGKVQAIIKSSGVVGKDLLCRY